MTLRTFYDAQRAWEWLQWQLSPQEWFDAQKALFGGTTPPVVQSPEITALLAEVMLATTPRPRKQELVVQLLRMISDGPQPAGQEEDGPSKSKGR